MNVNIFNILFLVLSTIIVCGIILSTNKLMAVSIIAIMLVCIWIGYDYIKLKRVDAKKHCALKPSKSNKKNKKHVRFADLEQICNEMDKDAEKNVKPEEPVKQVAEAPMQQNDKEIDIAMYNKEENIREIHGEMGFNGDTRICNRMKYMSVLPQVSKDIRAQWNTRSYQPFIEEELREGETRQWWDNDNLESQM